MRERLNIRNCLVTGGAGFIGTNFIRHALGVRPDWYFVNLDAVTYAGNPSNLADLPPQLAKRYRLVRGADDGLDTKRFVKRCHCHDRDSRRAVGAGDNTVV